MSDMDILKILAGAVIGGGITICGRIIFDWLKNRNAPPAPESIPASGADMFDLRRCDNKHKDIDEWKTGVDKCLVQHKGMLQAHEKRLDKGSRDFEEIKKGINGLNTSYAVLASASKLK